MHLLLLNLKETTKVSSNIRIIFLASVRETMAPKYPYKFKQFKITMPSISTITRYSISKLENIHYAVTLAQQHRNMKIISVHPGIVRTNLNGPAIESSLPCISIRNAAHSRFCTNHLIVTILVLQTKISST
jgi:NAD(P)-dependent dehydrogenase (short-subunit alcohol dehydrogenase family)